MADKSKLHLYYEVREPRIGFDDIGGLREVKERLREMVSLPLKLRESFEKVGLRRPTGVLLWGPPGGGKSLLAEAAAREAGANYITVKGIEIASEPDVIHDMFERARELEPCVVFINEIDSLAPRREVEPLLKEGMTRDAPMRFAPEDVTLALYEELDRTLGRYDVVAIGATYRPDILDPALLRNGRLERKIYVPPPGLEDRLEIFMIHTRRMPLAEDVDLRKLAELTEYYVGADIVGVCREAALLAIKEKGENVDKIEMKHFLMALERVKPSLSKELVEIYERVYREECKHRYMY